MAFDDELRATRIVPVIVIKDLAHAVPLARALVEGGLNILEITLRTDAGLAAIAAIASDVKGAIVGAGTVINAAQFAAAAQAGSKFVVSPGLTDEVVKASRDHNVPILPGVATGSEIMHGLSLGLSTFKFFPAETSGGAPAIKALGGPFPQVRFCPTGGVGPGNLKTYLSLPNVICAGGSWMVPSDLNEADAFAKAAVMAHEAHTFGPHMTSAISIGECMVELRPVEDGHLRRSFAGDAYNTAVYLKRSAPDIDVAFLTATGDESLSNAMVETWRGEGISDRLVYRIPGERPALYLIETNAKGDRKFHYWRSDTPAKEWLRLLLAAGGAEVLNKADLVYVSGISLAILGHDDRQAAIRLLGTLKTKVAFDPNIRPALWKSMDDARHTFEAMVKLASIVLPSRQDYQLMYEMSDPRKQIEFTATLTDAEIALTCDEDGCLLRVGGEITALPTQAVKVVDTSGAGDSFNGAYLAARLKGKPPQDAVKDGLALAARVVALPGALIPKA